MVTEALKFLTPSSAREIAANFGTPVYVYDEAALKRHAEAALAFPNAFGLTVRFAMKAAPNAAILRVFHRLGLHIDASSGFEVRRALHAGIPAEHISLSTQEFPEDFAPLYKHGIRFNACSLAQLERFGQLFPGCRCGLRINPGLGSGGTGKTNVGGPHSSFGIWHEWLGEAEQIIARYGLSIIRIHTHIGSGSDPAVWERVALMSLEMVKRFPDVVTLNLGGGYKVARMATEKATDLQKIGAPVKAAFEALAAQTGRQLKLEIEPGTFLVANAGALLATVRDVVRTGGPDGVHFLKLDSGMTEILRPSLYAAQHPLVIVPAQEREPGPERDYLVVGHCCESGDILTTAADDPEGLQSRTLPETFPGDLCVVEGAGAYCAAMSAKNYNSFPEAPEVLVGLDGQPRLIRRRQSLEQVFQNEVDE